MKSVGWFAMFAAYLALPNTLQASNSENNSVVWLEGESPTRKTLDLAPSKWAGVMSGDQWLQVSIDAGEVEKKLPAEGAVFDYDFDTAQQASYEIWNRIGFEFVRSDFEWQLDSDAAWTRVSPDAITTDLTEIGFWAEVAWLKLGTRNLAAGKHTLRIRLPRTYDAQHKIQHVLYASDAICITPGHFVPDGKFKPGDPTASSAADALAATNKISVPIPDMPGQTPISLKGVWQFARWDEELVQERTGPIASLPANDSLHWHSMQVPGDRNKVLPGMTFAHRYLLRTHIEIPEGDSLKGKAVYLHIPSVNFISTLFINGKQVSWTDTPYAVWDTDITGNLKPGINEVCVGIKDTYYALNPNDGKNLRYSMVLPTDFFNSNQGVSMQLDYPVWNHTENGILQEPSLIVTGSVYTSDVFAIPSVTKKTLGLEVSVHNSSKQVSEVQVENEIVPIKGGSAEKTFAPRSVQIPPGSDATVHLSEGWTNPHLWQPDDPQQYVVITRIRRNGAVIDERHTRFGFREWGWNGATFTLNGILWHGRADLADYGKANVKALATWKKHGQNWQRVWAETDYDGKEMEAALNFFDDNGIPVRRTGIFDGEGANYALTKNTTQNGKEVTVANRALFDNWRRQLVAWAKGQRNHPSIFVWSMENEITFINANVFGLNEYTDPEMKRAAAELAALDPTRPQMTDGGNALLDESLPIYGGHYLESELTRYPDESYTLEEARKSGSPGHQRWPITHLRPIVMGESFFAEGNDAAALATVGGESAYVGKAESYPAMGLIAKMLSEGYRWNEQVSFQLWMGGESDLYYNSWQPIAVLCRQWNWQFAAGSHVKRTLGIFNDTTSSDPITLTWSLKVLGKTIATATSVRPVGAGHCDKFDIQLDLPTVSARSEGELYLSLTVKNKVVFEDRKPLSILPAPNWYLGASGGASLSNAAASQAQIAVYDPSGAAGGYLKSRDVAFVTLGSLNSLPAGTKVLVIGKNAIGQVESGSSRLAAYAAAGHVVILLEQNNPLKYQALPAEMKPATNSGSIAYCEDLDHPLFSGIKAQDFIVWTGDRGTVYRDAYEKPTSRARSLIQCGQGLQNSALVEAPVGKGVMLFSQLNIEETLAANPIARQLLVNMLSYGVNYKQVYRPTTYVAAQASESAEYLELTKAIESMGIEFTRSQSALDALNLDNGIAIVAATPANLNLLASNESRVSRFTRTGGWLLLCGLKPEGLSAYNRIVGFTHMIRPFRQEKVTLPPVRSPLLAGLATSDIVMSSGRRIFDWQAGDYPDTNAFSYVVDYEDVAPFGTSTFGNYDKITNNFVGADGWPLIINFPAPTDGKPFDIPITFPTSQQIKSFTWIGDTNYWPQTQVNLIFDGKKTFEFKTNPDNKPQTFEINPATSGSIVTLQIAAWKQLPSVGPLIGIDNIYLKAGRPPDFYNRVKQMLNIGALMAYPRGKGGIVLCNVKFMGTETVPENAIKKRKIVDTVLHNLNAKFSGGKTVIAGAGLACFPIDISRQANAYRTAQGWFGDKNRTFANLPSGRHSFGGITYSVYDFTTSPVPTVIMLGGSCLPTNLPESVRDIPVNRKADALFFLQTARIDNRRSPDDIKNGRKFEMAAYIVHYADGSTERVPVYAEIGVDDYRQKSPAPLEAAQLGWSAQYGTDPEYAAAYSMQWNNPHPERQITTVDLEYGKDRRGIPVLLALTAAQGQ